MKGHMNFLSRMRNRILQDDGRAAEKLYAVHQSLSGKVVKRTGRGSDFSVRDVDFFGRPKGKSTYIEVKTGKAKLSPLQEATRKKKKSSYGVVRFI